MSSGSGNDELELKIVNAAKKKRGAEKGLTEDDIRGSNRDDDEEPIQTGPMPVADAETLSKRRIVKARRRGGQLKPENEEAAEAVTKDQTTAAPIFNFANTPSTTTTSSPLTFNSSTTPSLFNFSMPAKSSDENGKPASTSASTTSGFGSFVVSSPSTFSSAAPSSDGAIFSFSTAPSTFNFSTESSFTLQSSSSDAPSVATKAAPAIVLNNEPVQSGEEEDKQLFQAKAKLFMVVQVEVDGKKKAEFRQRGEGTIRLNEANDKSYTRLVFREDKVLTLKLNSRIWSDMLVEKATEKQIKFAAFSLEDGKQALFLARLASSEEAEKLLKLIQDSKQTAKPLTTTTSSAETKEEKVEEKVEEKKEEKVEEKKEEKKEEKVEEKKETAEEKKE
ncbi:hypothetical protein PROFUN_00632 [Planoprotostelium fungivorum]|uniref:RanBD1 domain-containing protein n=1 Tax=Planoprotostelium fungivorum TaxID=1890364 RepID=A0A2P6NTZ5_9EUKA|nr:hypothetical protein PROFUN_00632 [Planoprotostelium fungivorum]